MPSSDNGDCTETRATNFGNRISKSWNARLQKPNPRPGRWLRSPPCSPIRPSAPWRSSGTSSKPQKLPRQNSPRALDHLEALFQHNLVPIETWESAEYELVYRKMTLPTSHDAVLRHLAAAIRHEAEQKLTAAGVDVTALRERLQV